MLLDSSTGNQVAEIDFSTARGGVNACQVKDIRVKICDFDGKIGFERENRIASGFSRKSSASKPLFIFCGG